MRDPLAAETLSHLIGAIYDCALDPGRWPGVLAELREALGFAQGVMNVIGLPSGNLLLNVPSGIAPAWLAVMPSYGADVVEQWGGPAAFQAFPLDEPLVLSRVSPRDGWESNRYHTEWAKPQGIADAMALALARGPDTMGCVGLSRHESAGPIRDEEVTAARLLLPHLQRAVAIGRIIDLQTLAAATFARTLDALSAAVVLVGPDLAIVHANAAADLLLAAGDPIRAERGRLVARAPAAAMALAAAARQASEDEAAIGRCGFGVPAPRADGSPCLLHVLPMRRGVLRPGLAPGAAAAVFVAPAQSRPPAPTEALAALFDLTAAEARVFAQIADGSTLAEVASRLGIGPGTVKTHLVRIYAKTGARRQADLVRLAASLARPA